MRALKNATAFIISILMIVAFSACNSSQEESSKEEPTVEATTEAVTEEITEVPTYAETETAKENAVETNAKNGESYFEREAKDVIENNKYVRFDLGNISLELPWIDRCYPKEANKLESFNHLSCNQVEYEPKRSLDWSSIFITIDKTGFKSISDYDKWFQDSSYASDSVKKSLNNDNIGEVQYYKYHGFKRDSAEDFSAFYNVHSYIFLDENKKLIELKIWIPDDWSITCEDMVQHIFESIEISEKSTEINNEKVEETTVHKKEETSSDEQNQISSRTVYVTKTGKKYHYSSTCNGGKYYSSTLSEAKARGLTPCSKCVN